MTSKQSFKKIGSCLQNMQITPEKKVSTQTGLILSLNTFVSTGKTKALAVKAGMPHGRSGSLTLLNGMEITTLIETGNQNQPTPPQLTQQQKSLLMGLVYDRERIRGTNAQLPIPKIQPDDMAGLCKVYIQGMAALEPTPKNNIVKVTSILKVLFPGAKTDATSLKILLLKYAQVLSDEGYSFQAIDKGIDACLLNHKSDFMPTIETLNSYIKPIQLKLKQEMSLLKQVLERNSEHLALPAPQKQIEQDNS